MYEYSQLDAMLMPALQGIAHDLKINGFRKYKRKDLIEKIMEAGRSQNEDVSSAPETAKSEPEPTEHSSENIETQGKRARMRRPVGGNKVFTSLTGITGEKAGSSDVASLSTIKKTEPLPDKISTDSDIDPEKYNRQNKTYTFFETKDT